MYTSKNNIGSTEKQPMDKQLLWLEMEQLGGSNEEEAIKKELLEKTKYRDKDQTEQKKQ